MPVLGITGGIATGKSTFAHRLIQWLPARLFDADAAARELLERGSDARTAVAEVFGPGILGPDGEIDRSRLREIVFAEEAWRKKLEAILHPLIRTRWMTLAGEARREKSWLVADIPLLFETDAQGAFDAVSVVACSAATQRSRVVVKRGLSPEMADRIIASQQGLISKMSRASHVIWSDCSPDLLDRQAQITAAYLQERYG